MTLMIRPLAMLRHRRLRNHLDAFVDDELTAPEQAAVASHLDECPGCSQITRQLKRIKQSLRRSSLYSVDPESLVRMQTFADSLTKP